MAGYGALQQEASLIRISKSGSMKVGLDANRYRLLNPRLLGDSVQFFRAEAEMQRWQEEWESKQAEFLCCIRSFHKSSNVWQELSHVVSHSGEIAYARKKSAMFQEMAELATSEFIAAGYEDCLTTITGDQVLADLVTTDRQLPENVLDYGTKAYPHLSRSLCSLILYLGYVFYGGGH